MTCILRALLARVFYLLFALMLVVSVYNVYGQRPIVFKNIDVDNGLAHNTVLDIFQDKKGEIWIGTLDGLSKFNGIEFKTYRTNVLSKNPGLSNNQICKLFEDRAGHLWVGTTNGVNRYDRNSDQFISYKLAGANKKFSVVDIAEDSHGNILAGSAGGVYSLNNSDLGRSTLFFSKTAISGENVQCLYFDIDGFLWIGTTHSVEKYDLKEHKRIPLPVALLEHPKLLNVSVRKILQDHKGNFWIATETEGLFFYDTQNKKCIVYNNKNGLLSNTVRELAEINNKTIWIGTKNGLNTIALDNGRIFSYQHDLDNPTSLSENSVRRIFKDNEGDIWLGTYSGGVNIVYNQSDNFFNYGLKRGRVSGLTSGIVNAVSTDQDGSLWIGTDHGGLNHTDRSLTRNNDYHENGDRNTESLNNTVKAIAPGPDRLHLWLGTGTGLKIFNKQSHQFTSFNLSKEPPVNGMVQNYTLLADHGGLWAGNNFGGLYYIADGKVAQHYLPGKKAGNGIASVNITCLLRDGPYLWIGTRASGISRLHVAEQTFTNYQVNKKSQGSLSSNAILSICKDSKKRIWVGTDGGGLNFLDTASSRFYAVTEETGLLNNTIHQIIEDPIGRLWISSNKGLSCIKFAGFEVPFKPSKISIYNYTVQDGLQSNQFITGAGILNSNKQIIFGGIHGITIFSPEQIKTNLVKPSVILTDFSILNKPVQFGVANSPLRLPIDESQEITLKYEQAFFSISFAALNYINPQKNQFAFKLEGFSDKEWQYGINQRSVNYTNLDPGNYTFLVKAANNDGIWNEIPRALKIVVLPPWYRTWYAYIFYSVLIILLLYIFNLYSKRTERLKTQLEFETINHLKDQELAQKKLSFFINISHEIKTPLTLILGPIERLVKLNDGNNKIQNQLLLIQRNSERLVKLINQLLDIRKFDTGETRLEAAPGDVISFLKEISLAFSGLALSKQVNLEFKSDDQEFQAWFDRDKLEKIIYNLLSNAIKFSAAHGSVTLSVKPETIDGRDYYVIAVDDNGCGIPAKNLDKLFRRFYHDEYDQLNVQGTGLGLAYSKELIELHHGSITIESQPESVLAPGYTHVKVTLPVGRTHLKSEEILQNFSDSENIASYIVPEIPPSATLLLRKNDIIKNSLKERMAILLVEDNPEVLHFVKSQFEEDFEVYTAVDGIEGCTLAKEYMPDLVISDVMMPRMDGIELCRNLKSDIKTSHIPIILLTARTPLIFKMEGLETGADDYVTKPFNFSVLEARVWNLIDGRQKLRARYQKEIMLEPQNIAISETDAKFITKILTYIEKHIGDDMLNVEQLSEEIAMHRNTFTKKMKALTGQTAVEFIRTTKLKRASQLLSLGQMNVNEVAYCVGFSDVDHFRRCFKEQFGYTPKEQINLKKENT